MDRSTLQMIQRGLVAAVSFVLALIVITAFMDLIRTPDETVTRTTTTVANSDTTVAETTSTTSPTATATSTTVTDTTPAICIEDQPSAEDGTVLQIYLPCGSNELATGNTFVYRSVAPTDLVLTATLRELTRGLETEEADLGFRTPLPTGADGSFLGLSIVEGTAYIGFVDDSIFPSGVASAEGSRVFLSTLNANVFQFSSISAVEYRIGSSCDAFWQQLGRDECDVVNRSEWQASLPEQ